MVAFDVTPWSALMEDADIEELVAELVNRPQWHADALCREYPSVDFFPPTGRSTAPAQAVCLRCAVRPECLSWALETRKGLHGVWGGTTRQQRRIARTEGWTAVELLAHVGAATPADRVTS